MRSSPYAGLLAAALCALASATAAQPLPPPAAGPSAAPVQGGITPSPRSLQLARQVVEESGARATFTRLLAAAAQDVSAAAASADPRAAADPRIAAEVARDVDQRLGPAFLDAAADAYARTYTEEELVGIAAFFRTPAGRAVATKAELLQQNMAAAGRRMIPQVRREVIDSYCTRARCSAALRQSLQSGGPGG